MKKIRGSLFAKITAIFLLTAMVTVLLLSGLGVIWIIETDGYTGDYSDSLSKMVAGNATARCYEVGSEYLYMSSADLAGQYGSGSIRFNIYDGAGKLLFKGYAGEDTLWEGKVRVYESGGEGHSGYVTVEGYVLANLSADDWFGRAAEVYSRVWVWREWLAGAAAAGAILGLMLFIFLMCAAGHRDGGDEVRANGIDRIPFDLFTVLLAVAATAIAEILINTNLSCFDGMEPVSIAVLMLGLLGLYFIVLMFMLSLATRLKLGGFGALIKGSLCWRILCLCWRILLLCLRGLGKLFGALGRFIHALPMLGRWGFVIGGVLLAEFIVIMSTECEAEAELFLWFVERVVLVAGLVYVLSCAKRLRDGAKQLAAGNDSYVIDAKNMRGDLLDHARDLNNIGTGINRAVNERMKSERFKTELITNVSHDIKTPLTSIVNYVDLLSKEEPENEKMREYIDVLSRQSARLKKLIDDLIEASKASTGNMSVNLERCELGVLLDQTAGEYGERLSRAGLELVLTKPENPVTVMADGRHMWRVFDNLMNNALKYAQPGTRVYLSLMCSGGRAEITFRNISRSQLNISGDELMERFVRGDSSRNTEGSGLGLSIARSLVQLQNGDMVLTVDGDLFKVTLSFASV